MKRKVQTRSHWSSIAPRALLPFTAAVATLAAGSAAQAAEAGSSLQNGSIGYVLTQRYYAVYESKDGKTECPQGFNEGNREQFKELFPDKRKWTVVETQLRREGEQWHPENSKDAFPFHEAQGKISFGMNLDGKVGPEDFQSPEGEKGIDNQMYRVLGCIAGYRTDGAFYHFENQYMRQYNDNRVLIELTGVDDLVNDNDVTLTTYRGLDSLLTDATGNAFLAGGTQRIDMRWGQDYIQSAKGKIVNGTLITEPMDVATFPWAMTFDNSSQLSFKGLRFKLKITPDGAEGLMAGYVDVEEFADRMNEAWSTHHQSYGKLSSISQYHAMKRLADGYPDPKTGANTAISLAIRVKFKQTFVQHPPEERLTQQGRRGVKTAQTR